MFSSTVRVGSAEPKVPKQLPRAARPTVDRLGTAVVGADRAESAVQPVKPRARWHVFLAVFGLYLLGATIAWDVFNGVVFFPPAGITTAAGLLLPRRHLPAITLAAVCAEVIVNVAHDVTFVASFGYAAANGLVPIVGVMAFFRLNGEIAMRTHRGMAAFLVGCVGIGPLIGAAIGASVRLRVEGGHWPLHGAQWFAGDAIAVLVIAAPALMLASAPPNRRWGRDAGIGAVGASVVIAAGMLTPLPTALFALPILFAAALRLGNAGVVFMGAVIAFTANVMTTWGHGPYADLEMSADSRLAWMQLSIAVLIVSGWWFSIEVSTRLRTARESAALLHAQEQRLSATRVLEHALRPSDPISSDALEIGACYRPAEVTVGGDWHDTLMLPDGRTVFMVGDVVGHGLSAVGDMTQLRYACRTLLLEGHDLVETVGHLSRVTLTATQARFATLAIAVFDPRRSATQIVLAGHPPPVLWSSPGANAHVVDVAPGLPLGVNADDAEYAATTISLRPGDILVLYTDGLVERRDRSIDDGIAHLQTLLTDAHALGIDELCEFIARNVYPTDVPTDDVCVLAARRGFALQGSGG